jgi:hypothetical protein
LKNTPPVHVTNRIALGPLCGQQKVVIAEPEKHAVGMQKFPRTGLQKMHRIKSAVTGHVENQQGLIPANPGRWVIKGTSVLIRARRWILRMTRAMRDQDDE